MADLSISVSIQASVPFSKGNTNHFITYPKEPIVVIPIAAISLQASVPFSRGNTNNFILYPKASISLEDFNGLIIISEDTTEINLLLDTEIQLILTEDISINVVEEIVKLVIDTTFYISLNTTQQQ